MGFVEGRLARGYVGASLLFLASWACNDYFLRFSGSYVNSTMFRIIGQAYSGDMPVYIAISARRRDGEILGGGYEHGEVTFNVPVQCSVRHPAVFDEKLLAGLSAAVAADSEVASLLRTTLPFVEVANTDDEEHSLLRRTRTRSSTSTSCCHGERGASRRFPYGTTHAGPDARTIRSGCCFVTR